MIWKLYQQYQMISESLDENDMNAGFLRQHYVFMMNRSYNLDLPT